MERISASPEICTKELRKNYRARRPIGKAAGLEPHPAESSSRFSIVPASDTNKTNKAPLFLLKDAPGLRRKPEEQGGLEAARHPAPGGWHRQSPRRAAASRLPTRPRS